MGAQQVGDSAIVRAGQPVENLGADERAVVVAHILPKMAVTEFWSEFEHGFDALIAHLGGGVHNLAEEVPPSTQR